MSDVNLKAICKSYLKAATIVSAIVLTFGAAASAQSINDDLKPKTTTAKPKPAAKPAAKPATKPPVKMVKKTGSRSERKTNVARAGSSESARTKTPAVSFSETPDQILNRFMNFQQSAGVSDRDWNSVIAQQQKILKEDPNHARAKTQTLLAQGQIAHSQGGYAMAMTHFKEALRIMPSSSVLHYSLGRTYLANGQAAAAERSFKTAIDRNKDFALAYKGLGDAFEAQGEKKTALKYFKKATEISVRDGNMNP